METHRGCTRAERAQAPAPPASPCAAPLHYRKGGYSVSRKSEWTNSGATNPAPFLKNERTNYAELAIVAHEKQWTLPVISWWTLDGCCYLIRQKAAMCGQHKHADVGIYFSTCATSMETNHHKPNPLAWYNRVKAQPNVHLCKTLKTPSKLRTTISHRICSTETVGRLFYPFPVPQPPRTTAVYCPWTPHTVTPTHRCCWKSCRTNSSQCPGI